MTEPYLVVCRHGDSYGNWWDNVHGMDRLNFLTPVGAQQAAAVQFGGQFSFKRFYASEMTRAQQTLIHIMHANDTGMDFKSIYIRNQLNEIYHPETWDQARVRCWEFIHEMAIALEEGDILATSHNYLMKVLFDCLQSRPFDESFKYEHCAPQHIALSHLQRVFDNHVNEGENG